MSTSGEKVRIGVVGCGAIGSLYAAHLARNDDVEVWAVDVSAPHVSAMNERGLRVTGAHEFTVSVHAITDPDDLPPCDFGVIATKSSITRRATRGASHAFADAAVASMQNGVGNEEIIAEFVPRVIRATILPAGTLVEPGVVRYDAPGESWIGPFEPKPATPGDVDILARLLTEGGLPTRGLPDVRGAQWTKLIFNAATSPIGALTGLSVGQLCEVPELLLLVERLIDESLQVADALGIGLDSDPRDILAEAERDAFWHRASMLQDVEARRSTEIDVLNGGIVRAGGQTGVATPLNEALVALITGLERSWTVDRHPSEEQR